MSRAQRARSRGSEPPKNGRAPGHHPEALAEYLAHLTSRIIVDDPTDNGEVRWVPHAWWRCALRSNFQPFAHRCPSCCRCEEWHCDCPEHVRIMAEAS